MNGEMALFGDGDHKWSEQVVNTATGKVQTREFALREVLDEAKVCWTAMSDELKDLVLYEKAAPGGKGKKPVKLGDLGPLVLVKVLDGQIANLFSLRDFGKPMPISVHTLKALCRIFREQEVKAK